MILILAFIFDIVFFFLVFCSFSVVHLISYNVDLLHDAKTMHDTNGTRSPQLKANHPDVLKNVLSTVVHEVGHTLGLRHNFIAQEDGNTSAMCYSDDLDTTSYFSATANNNTNSSIGVSEAKYGGHFVCPISC